MENEKPLTIWLSHHLHDARSSLQRIVSTPLQTWPIIALFSIALSLPMMLLMSTTELQTLGQLWGQQQEATLYLKTSPPTGAIEALRQDPMVKKLEWLTPSEALHQFEQQTGLHHLSDLMATNPLPHQLHLFLNPNLSSEALQQFATKLEALDYVEEVLIDFEWLQKAQLFIKLAQLTVMGLGFLFGGVVVLVIYNTTRLSIEENRQTIVVSKLIGATHRFIRRPFLYLGFWQGLLGGIFAWILVITFDRLIYTPLKGLFTISTSSIASGDLTWIASVELLLLGGLLGLTGAWFSVNRYIHRIDIQN